ncbi:deoxynucleoside kinase [Fructobacillus evanidus]|uniref:Deoxyadenosine/deoxycytidine kinase (Dck) n=1 Tax=Fructobacillus evanidus TaxID=3064281 RepID=A0ABM9N0S1_9LACO|nr:Deoxyadenosine/deoxycytidine kinase (Dck) [Fructobacillus sp. LMG 32999]CAK1247257.1 Deoxyadenosine/deoxycytidine kinase (Dck) [Fructobacillus sp. LMG 32999]CAK1251993.1 Deoxyadenosine/deoxycytidine kinase (Dck) [Fructobacillus sp. LMG 32999]CAK1252017.1 Deoxyadenosine/deoxycytidine kinase (Dck) [Fructobacillus sp. LMG 32999]CAK1252131.1 Deoxyadenosine/deoxycytidine kinase (Dck) [Fructobacillus sp. LMG 32999]
MIVLAGTIGAGKTSLTEILAKHLGGQAYYESVDNNPILPLFYQDPKKYSFLLQIYFLNTRLDQIHEAQQEKNAVLDRSIFEDALLFQLNADLGRATQTEVDIYKDLVNNVLEEVSEENKTKTPDLLIHVRVSLDTMLARIKKRGRPYEQIEQDPDLYQYYADLNARYDAWFDQYDRSPKLQINGDELNFVEDAAAEEKVLALVDQKLAELAADKD